MRIAVFVTALLVASGAAVAKEKAAFIEGTYATQEGCDKLDALAGGKPRSVESVPDVLTSDGFKGWEGACEFTKVYEHEAGRVYIGLMFCGEGATLAPQTYAFIKGEDGSFEVAASGQDQPDLYVRCDQRKRKK